MKTEINHFDDLLHAARAQRERQRLLLVFAGTELPEGATPGQRERFAQGDGGVLVPMMCLDRLPEELESFAALLRESRQFEPPGQPWRLVFTAALSGTPTRAPSEDDAERDAVPPAGRRRARRAGWPPARSTPGHCRRRR